ncbi:MAG: apolipoprotein N-acyltransferase [bacterium]|nr:apolipoprotein N-acyltransferase [bacterium]
MDGHNTSMAPGWIHRQLPLLVLIFSALMLVCVFPPLEWLFLVWFVLVPLLWYTDTVSIKKAFLLSYLYGVVFFAGLLYWVVYVTVPGAVVLVLYLAVYFPFFILSIRFIRNILCIPYLVSAPLVFCFTEYLRSIVMTGLPWDNIGYAFATDLPFIQIIEFTGTAGLSFLAVCGNVLIYSLLCKAAWCKRKYGCWYIKFKEYAVLLIGCFVFLLFVIGIRMWGMNRLEYIDSLQSTASLRIALIQANIAQMEKWDARFKAGILKKYDALTRQAAVHNPDIIIWPESSLPGFFRYDENSTYTVFSLLADLKIPMVFGGNRVEYIDDRVFYYNSAYYAVPDNDSVRTYDKIHLVPYGEYIPQKKVLTQLVPRLESVVPFEDFTPGKSVELFVINDVSFGVSICYEDIFPDLIRKIPLAGAQFIVNITNDAWYLHSSAPFQHFGMSVFRAIENRKPLIRCANTGITGWVTPAGETDLFYGSRGSVIFDEGYKIINVPIYDGPATFYTKHGEWFLYLCSMISGILLCLSCVYYVAKTMLRINEVKYVRRN